MSLFSNPLSRLARRTTKSFSTLLAQIVTSTSSTFSQHHHGLTLPRKFSSGSTSTSHLTNSSVSLRQATSTLMLTKSSQLLSTTLALRRSRFPKASRQKITTKFTLPKAQALRIGSRFSLKSLLEQTTTHWTDSLSLLLTMFLTMVNLLWY